MLHHREVEKQWGSWSARRRGLGVLSRVTPNYEPGHMTRGENPLRGWAGGVGCTVGVTSSQSVDNVLCSVWTFCFRFVDYSVVLLTIFR